MKKHGLKTSLFALAAALAGSNAAAQEWSGVYVGGHVATSTGESSSNVALGGQWGIESAALRTGVTNLWSTQLDPEGFSYGLQAGLNHEFSGGFVLGGELSYSVADIDDRRALPLTATSFGANPTYAPVNSVEVESLWGARALIGYNFNPVLAYVTVGYASADITARAEIVSNGGYSKAGEGSDSVDGVSYGVGAAFRLGASPWSVRVEYSRTDLSDITFATAYRPGSTFTTPAYTETFTQDLSLDTFQVGVNFHF